MYYEWPNDRARCNRLAISISNITNDKEQLNESNPKKEEWKKSACYDRMQKKQREKRPRWMRKLFSILYIYTYIYIYIYIYIYYVVLIIIYKDIVRSTICVFKSYV